MNYTINNRIYGYSKRNTNLSTGFTLIELMIVVAIIGILAAIAVPQYSTFRIRAFNEAAISDLRNTRTVQEVLFTTYSFYGTTDPDTTLAAAIGTGNQGKLIDGSIPLAPGNSHFVAISAANGGPARALVLPLSNGVQLRMDSDVNETTYIGAAEHIKGNRAYATDKDALPLYWVQNDKWIGAAPGINAIVPAPTNLKDDLVNTNGNGFPTANWTLQ